jgi:hypothetical protein
MKRRIVRSRDCWFFLFLVCIVLLSLHFQQAKIEPRSHFRTIIPNFSSTCSALWHYLSDSQDGFACIGNSPEEGQFCVADRVCVNRSHGAWISVSGNSVMSNTPGIVMMGVDLSTDPFRKSFPVRRENFRQEELEPLVIGSFYECAHMSHFFLNGAFPAAASAMRLTNHNKRPFLIAERVHGECNFDTFSTLESVYSNKFSRDGIMRLDQPESLPEATRCFGTSVLGLRRTCFHSYCPRLIERFEVDYFSNAVKNHYNLGTNSNTLLLKQSIKVTFVQRRKTRVILNLEAVVELFKAISHSAMMAMCRGFNFTHDERFSWISDPNLLLHVCQIETLISTEIVELEDLPYVDQIRLFSNTDILVAAHGNAIGNAVWMPHYGAVVECFMKGWWSPWFMDPVKDILGLDYSAVTSTHTILSTEQELAEKEAKVKGEDEGLLKRRNILLDADDTAYKLFLIVGRVFTARMSQLREKNLDRRKVMNCL